MDQLKEAEEKTPFVVDDDKKANWAFRKLAEVKEKLDIKAKQKAAFDKQTQDWYESETKPLKESQQYFEQLIEQYRQTQPDKRVKVPAGYTSIRHTKDFQKDTAKLIPYVKENFPDYLKEDIKWGDFKRKLKVHGEIAIDPNGEEVPGIRVAEKESITYRTNKLGDDL